MCLNVSGLNITFTEYQCIWIELTEFEIEVSNNLKA